MHRDQTLLNALQTQLGVDLNNQNPRSLITPSISLYSTEKQSVIINPFVRQEEIHHLFSDKVLLDIWKDLAKEKQNSKKITITSEQRNKGNPEHFYYHCLELMNTPILGLVSDTIPDLDSKRRSGISQLMLPYYLQLIQERLRLELPIESIEEEKIFFYKFAEIVSQFLIPHQLKILSEPVRAICRSLSPGAEISFKLGARVCFSCTLPRVSSKSSELKAYQLSIFKDFMQEQFVYWHAHWQNVKRLGLYQSVGKLQDSIKTLQDTAQEVISISSRLTAELVKLNAPKNVQTENEFYKGTTGWTIRFQNQNVKMKRQNHKGLFYIHKLLSYPNTRFYPNQLEDEIPSKTKDAVNVALFETYQKAGIDIIPYKHAIDDEDELKVILKRLLSDGSKDGPKDNLSKLEGHIYYLAEVLLIIKALINNKMRKEYIDLYKEKKEQFDEAKFMLRRMKPSPFFIEEVINKYRVISKPIEWDKNTRQVRQRVSKAIKNSIDALDSPALQDYFRETITFGAMCEFNPRIENPIQWHLNFD